MNRGLMFYMPTAGEYTEYNVQVLDRADFQLEGVDSDSPSGSYLLASYAPTIVLRLTRPDLTWCVDSDLLKRHETRINVGSSYFVMDRCVLGPSMHYSDASLDRRAAAYVESFANDVSNGLRWIIQIYQTTNILQQHDLFDMDLAVAKKMHNKLAFENYTPFQLVTELNESTDCEEVQMCSAADRPFYIRQFGFSSGAAPIGGVGRFSRPHLGTAPVTGFCSLNPEDLAVRDPYVVNADDMRRLNEMIAKNREDMVGRYFSNIFRPMSGLGVPDRTAGHDESVASRCTGGNTGDRSTLTTVDEQMPQDTRPPPPQTNIFEPPPINDAQEDYDSAALNDFMSY